MTLATVVATALVVLACLATADALRSPLHMNLARKPQSPRPAQQTSATPKESRKVQVHFPEWSSMAGPGNCTLMWYNQTLDHFSWKYSTSQFPQRYYVCSDAWGGPGSPMFFYTGNEGDVTLYLNHTGLMWENAAEYKALLVFAEHRYYGETQPGDDMSFLTHEQAMADYAELIHYIKYDAMNTSTSPVIVFGGSYGGMLSAWMRMKYANTVDGAIASSAPIFGFQGFHPEYDSETYWGVVTRDATPAAGAAAPCAGNVRSSWQIISDLGQTQAGRDTLKQTFGICEDMTTPYDAYRLSMFLLMAFDTLAMGNYPYPSNYLTGGGPLLPAYPVVAACKFLNITAPSNATLLAAMKLATDVYNNATLAETCYDLPDDIEQDGIWDYQYCTEMLPQETYFSMDGVRDMFWPQPFNQTFVNDRCQGKYGFVPRPEWIRVSYGDRALKGASNIVFANGLLDPWSSAGVAKSISDSLVAIQIPHGAHHVDLFFSNPNDPSDITDARNTQKKYITKWIKEANASTNAL